MKINRRSLFGLALAPLVPQEQWIRRKGYRPAPYAELGTIISDGFAAQGDFLKPGHCTINPPIMYDSVWIICE